MLPSAYPADPQREVNGGIFFHFDFDVLAVGSFRDDFAEAQD